MSGRQQHGSVLLFPQFSFCSVQLADQGLDVGHLVDLDVLPLPDGDTAHPTGQQLMKVSQVLLDTLWGRKLGEFGYDDLHTNIHAVEESFPLICVQGNIYPYVFGGEE